MSNNNKNVTLNQLNNTVIGLKKYNDTCNDAINVDISKLKENQIEIVEDDTSIEGISDTVHGTLETNDKTIIGAINEVNSQYKDIANELGRNEDDTEIDMGTTSKTIRGAIKELKDNQNNNVVTQEQIDSAVTSYLNANPVIGGITTTAKNLLITILRNAMYTTNQSNNITLLESALASSEGGGSTPIVTTYTITNNLTNCLNSNVNTSVVENSSYVANITANEGYSIDSVVITMDGTNITSSSYSNGQINITNVTGNIVITANAIIQEQVAELVTDGLENYFDFRTAKYNNSGSGGSTIIEATQGNGSLYCWASNQVTTQDNHGIVISRALIYNGKSVGTTQSNCGKSFTWIFKCYLDNRVSPLFAQDYGQLSNLYALTYKPKYNKSSGTAQVTAEDISSERNTGYNTFTISVNNNICKLYKDATLLKTIDGSTISDFVSWYDKLNTVILGGGANGHITQLAIYNKALSEVQLVNMIDYLKSLEVTA